jgi:hypothetical protein
MRRDWQTRKLAATRSVHEPVIAFNSLCTRPGLGAAGWLAGRPAAAVSQLLPRRDYLSQFRGTTAGPTPAPRPPNAKKVPLLAHGRPAQLTADDKARLTAILAQDPELAAPHEHIAAFRGPDDQTPRPPPGARDHRHHSQRPARAAFLHHRPAQRPRRCGGRTDPALELRRGRKPRPCELIHRVVHTALGESWASTPNADVSALVTG